MITFQHLLATLHSQTNAEATLSIWIATSHPAFLYTKQLLKIKICVQSFVK